MSSAERFELDPAPARLDVVPPDLVQRLGRREARQELGLELDDGIATLAGAALLTHKPEAALGCLLVELEEHRAPLDLGLVRRRRALRLPWAHLLRTIPAEVDILPPERAQHRERYERLVLGVVANALCHRSFGPEHRDAPVHLAWGPGQLRVASPGRLVPGVAQDGPMLRGVHPRNPHLHFALRQLGLARMENRGGLEGPVLAGELGFRQEVTATPDQVIVDLRVDPALLRRAQQQEQVARRSRSTPEARRAELVAALRQHGELSRPQLQRLVNGKRGTVTADLRHLLEEGVVERTSDAARAPGQTYRLASQD